MTNRTIAILGAGVGVVGVVYEFFLSPSAKASIAQTKAAGKPLGPLGSRPLSSVGKSPIIPAKAPAATVHTVGNPSPGTTSGGLGLNTLIGGIGKLFSSFGSDKKPQPGGGSSGLGGGSSLGGAPSSGGAGNGRQAPTGLPNDYAPSNFGAGGAAYSQASEVYVDTSGQVAYLQPDGTYQDDWGNEVYLDSDGAVQYGSGADYWAQNDGGVGFVSGGEVFPDSADPTVGVDSTFYGDGGPLADPGGNAYDGTYDASDDANGGDGVDNGGGFLPSDQTFAFAEATDTGGDYSDYGGGGDGSNDADYEDFSDGF